MSRAQVFFESEQVKPWRRYCRCAEVLARWLGPKGEFLQIVETCGAGLREIADILGHKTLAMVQRYSHLTQDHKIATVERMTNAIFGTEDRR
jgi:Phage integrase family.